MLPTRAAMLVFAAPAAAQSPTYGGGLLPAASAHAQLHADDGHRAPAARRDERDRFDTSLRCGRQTYEQPAGRAIVPFDGRSFSAARKHRHITLVGGRVTYSWTLSGQVDGTMATGTLRITGVERRNGHRTYSVYSDYGVSGPAKIGLSGMGARVQLPHRDITVEDVRYDAVGNLTRFRVSFENHCEHAGPALRGAWDFTAAG